MRKLSLLILAIGLLAVISPVSARVYHDYAGDLGTFAADSTVAGDSLQISQMTIQVGVQTVTASNYDDTIHLYGSQDGTNWFVIGNPISGDVSITLEPVFRYIRVDPVGGGTAGTITIMLMQVYEL